MYQNGGGTFCGRDDKYDFVNEIILAIQNEAGETFALKIEAPVVFCASDDEKENAKFANQFIPKGGKKFKDWGPHNFLAMKLTPCTTPSKPVLAFYKLKIDPLDDNYFITYPKTEIIVDALNPQQKKSAATD